MNKHSKNFRILDIYIRLTEGKVINKTEEAVRYGVDERSIQRDIDDIRAFMAEQGVFGFSDGSAIEYKREKKGFVMTGTDSVTMSNSEILSINKILNERKTSDIGQNYTVCNYTEPEYRKSIMDKLFKLGENIEKHVLLELDYVKSGISDLTIKRIVEPVAILFSKGQFYLNAYIVEKTEIDKYVHRYDYPDVFNLEMIRSYKRLDSTYINSYSESNGGSLNKHTQFMYAGRLIKIQLKYYGSCPETIIDRFPTARIIQSQNRETIIEAEVYGTGIIIWLLSQGSQVEVLKPELLIKEIRKHSI